MQYKTDKDNQIITSKTRQIKIKANNITATQFNLDIIAQPLPGDIACNSFSPAEPKIKKASRATSWQKYNPVL